MKSYFIRLVAVASVLWLGFAAGSANAVALTFNGWTSGGGGYSTNFGNSVLTSFADWLDFTLPADSSGNGASNLVSLSFGSGIMLTKFELWDGTNLLGSGLAGGTGSSLTFVGGTVPGAYSLKINGSVGSGGGSYFGNIVINPVPEPQTYAMLLAGLALVGFSARRMNKSI
jgi:hypothetical protein